MKNILHAYLMAHGVLKNHDADQCATEILAIIHTALHDTEVLLVRLARCPHCGGTGFLNYAATTSGSVLNGACLCNKCKGDGYDTTHPCYLEYQRLRKTLQ